MMKNNEGFELRKVKLGLTDKNFAQILEGINQDEIVSNNNTIILKSESEKASSDE